MKVYKLFILFLLFSTSLFADTYLRDNLKRAQPGDYIATAQNKMYTLLFIRDKTPQQLTIEEISVPIGAICPENFSWKSWVASEAPGNTAWVVYDVNLDTAHMSRFYSYTKNSWYDMSPADNFLSTLLNMRLEKIPYNRLKKVGPPPIGNFPDLRKPWQPKMIADGREIKGVKFAAWHTVWPNDRSELSGKAIEVYVPEENERYPSYFPYWLQISGMVGKAKVRIIDSGSGMQSPRARAEVF